MSVREIPTHQWREFLQDFSRGHNAWLATVDSFGPDGSHRGPVVERPLQAVRAAVEENRVVGIDIRFHRGSDVRDAIHIQTPVSVRVDETSEGVARALEIVDDVGERTRLRFRSAPRNEILDGVAPGEEASK